MIEKIKCQIGFGGANAAGIGNGAVVGNQAIGTGTGIANAGPGITRVSYIQQE